MHVPKPQPIPPPPNPVPHAEDRAVLDARQNELRRQRSAYGRKSTNLTGGVGDTSLSSPTLLGA